ncbi:hypothetical protein ACGFZQ_41210 [Streptomyces sp. NPDC048254]
MQKGTRETADLPAEEHQRRLAEGEGIGLVGKGLRGYAVKE